MKTSFKNLKPGDLFLSPGIPYVDFIGYYKDDSKKSAEFAGFKKSQPMLCITKPKLKALWYKSKLLVNGKILYFYMYDDDAVKKNIILI